MSSYCPYCNPCRHLDALNNRADRIELLENSLRLIMHATRSVHPDGQGGHENAYSLAEDGLARSRALAAKEPT